MYSIGVDIGGMSIKTGAVDENGNIVLAKSIHTNTGDGFVSMVKNLTEVIWDVCNELGIEPSALKGIGLGIPGVADSKSGIVKNAANIGWRNVNIVDEMKKYFDVPIKISNDANCAALGEQRYGGGKAFNSIIFITLGTGIGSGIVIDGKLVEGAGSAGAESGHILFMPDGEPCACGKRGCWESYGSATALIKQTKREMGKSPFSLMHDIAKAEGKISGRTAFKAYDRGDEAGKKVVEQYLYYLAQGLISLGNVLHPECFVIGGGISHEGDNLIVPLQRYLDNYFIEASGFEPRILVKQADLGNDAGIIGASLLVE